MNPYFESECGRIKIFNNDSRLLDIKSDAIVTDPPYGIEYSATERRRPNCIDYGTIIGDECEFDPRPLLFCKNVILWGANNYTKHLPIGGWLVWDKRVSENADKMAGSPFELAYIKISGSKDIKGNKFKIARIQHGGAKNADALNGDVANAARFHPTQKPVSLMAWCLKIIPKCETIYDPFMGSGSTGIACIKEGRKFIGAEISREYCEIAVRRLKAELNTPYLPTFEPQLVQGLLDILPDTIEPGKKAK